MPSEVKMPQLGMTQDSGVIVAWLKAQGDAVSEGEPIFEVETDKATMEVQAAASGFLSGVRAAEGDDVPVGEVIAMIVESADAVVRAEGRAAPAPKAEAAPVTASPAAPEPKPATKPAAAAAAPRSGKVLASPLAKRMAAEKGIDLAALRAEGVAEPIHAADLAKAGSSGGKSVLSASATGSAFDGLLERSPSTDRTLLLAAFAAGAWRARFAAESVAIAIRGLDGALVVVGDPDRGGEGATDNAVLTLVDLCGTRLTSFAPARGGITLSAARSGGSFVLSLAFSEGTLPLADAAAVLNDIAARVEDPIRQIL